MSSTNEMRNYKHDISGKFKDIQTALDALDESAFEDPENNEIFHAVHEVLLKMVKTSRNTMLANLKQEIVLVVSDKEADLELSKLQIEGVVVRYEMSRDSMKYYLFLSENAGDPDLVLAKVQAALPVRKIEREFVEREMNDFVKRSFSGDI